MTTKTKATVYVIEATPEAEKLHFKSGECYRCEFIDPEYAGQEGHFFDQVETGMNNWVPISTLIRSGAIIKYKINE